MKWQKRGLNFEVCETWGDVELVIRTLRECCTDVAVCLGFEALEFRLACKVQLEEHRPLNKDWIINLPVWYGTKHLY